MYKDEVRQYFLSKKGAVEETPFKMAVPVFKVGGKIFALINLHEKKDSINLKYPKDSIEMLRSNFDDIVPGYHMNKNHWNTLYIENLGESVLKDLIDISYDLVFNALTKEVQKQVNS